MGALPPAGIRAAGSARRPGAAQVVAEEGDRELFEHFLAYTPEVAPVNDPHEFLAFCGVVGLGRLLAEGDGRILDQLRPYASNPRWRLREGLAMALQRLGKRNMRSLLVAMETWSTGNWLENRAAAAALAEPVLLHKEKDALQTLQILDRITASMDNSLEAGSTNFKILQQGLGYCWSVVVVAAPQEGKRLMEKWLVCPDHAIHRIMQENLKKNRMRHMDAACRLKLGEVAFSYAYEAGRVMTLEQAVAYALDVAR